ncbi:hypothetical protein [Acidiphilium acidophilum]|uniref:hypothetical protein n=1 Tax=Acidiphilium acidophilum TaxID=76588 RepID=UPI002E8E6ADE|nr:hypothetical protein [Acidiphilium acidophilum]
MTIVLNIVLIIPQQRSLKAMDSKVVPLKILAGSPPDGLRFTPGGTAVDPRLIAMVRLLARQAADAYYDQSASPKEDYLPRR